MKDGFIRCAACTPETRAADCTANTERIIDMMRTTVNVASDAVVAALIADNENEINYDLLNNTEGYKEII